MEAVAAWSAWQWVQAAGTAISAISAINQGNNQSQNYESQAQANAYNADVARQNAETAASQGNANEEAQRRKTRIVLGNQRAAIAEAGLSGSDTAGDLYAQSVSNAEMDALNIRYQAQLQGAGFQNQANLDDWQADQNRTNASRARTASYIGAGAAALSGYGRYLEGVGGRGVGSPTPKL